MGLLSDTSTLEKHSAKVDADSVNKKLDVDNNNNSNSPSEQQNILTNEQTVIPIKEERFSISKETVTENVKIEKRWITKSKKVEVPVFSEEIYVNGRRLKYYDKLLGSNILSKVKDRLKEGLDSIGDDKKEQGYSMLEAHESNREFIPLFEGVKNGTDVSNKEMEKVIPIFGEEILITKRKIKVGELVIKKNRVTVNNKIEIDIKKEEVTVKRPEVIKHSTDNI